MTEPYFSNQNLKIDALPQVLNLDYQDLSAKYAPANLMIGIVTTSVLLILAAFIYYQTFIDLTDKLQDAMPFIAAGIVIFGVLIVSFGYWADLKKGYALRELDLHYKSGLFFRKIVSQPITRIQHIELKRGPIDRKIGLAKLQVFSAGGAMHTFEIPGIEVALAQQIRQFILKHKDVCQHD